MSAYAISDVSSVGAVQPVVPTAAASNPSHNPAAEVTPAKPLSTGTPYPLSAAVLAALVVEQTALAVEQTALIAKQTVQRGSFSGG